MREEYAIILDYLPHGYAASRYAIPIAQAIGVTNFTLLELIPKPDVELKPEERVYIGSGERDKIDRVRRRLKLNDLTSLARETLEAVLDKLIKENESRLVERINQAGLITPRLHQLELLPGVGKKLANAIINARPFSSFEDINKRTGIKDIAKLIKRRILEEMEGREKYYIFTKPFPQRMF